MRRCRVNWQSQFKSISNERFTFQMNCDTLMDVASNKEMKNNKWKWCQIKLCDKMHTLYYVRSVCRPTISCSDTHRRQQQQQQHQRYLQLRIQQDQRNVIEKVFQKVSLIFNRHCDSIVLKLSAFFKNCLFDIATISFEMATCGNDNDEMIYHQNRWQCYNVTKN